MIQSDMRRTNPPNMKRTNSPNVKRTNPPWTIMFACFYLIVLMFFFELLNFSGRPLRFSFSGQPLPCFIQRSTASMSICIYCTNIVTTLFPQPAASSRALGSPLQARHAMAACRQQGKGKPGGKPRPKAGGEETQIVPVGEDDGQDRIIFECLECPRADQCSVRSFKGANVFSYIDEELPKEYLKRHLMGSSYHQLSEADAMAEAAEVEITQRVETYACRQQIREDLEEAEQAERERAERASLKRETCYEHDEDAEGAERASHRRSSAAREEETVEYLAEACDEIKNMQKALSIQLGEARARPSSARLRALDDAPGVLDLLSFNPETKTQALVIEESIGRVHNLIANMAQNQIETIMELQKEAAILKAAQDAIVQTLRSLR